MYIKVDKLLRDVQVKLIEIVNEIQKVREDRLRATPTKKEKKDMVLLETTEKLNKVFTELGYAN